jgi:hypothetical protein
MNHGSAAQFRRANSPPLPEEFTAAAAITAVSSQDRPVPPSIFFASPIAHLSSEEGFYACTARGISLINW